MSTVTVNDYIAYGEGFYSPNGAVSRPKRASNILPQSPSSTSSKKTSKFVMSAEKKQSWLLPSPEPHSSALSDRIQTIDIKGNQRGRSALKPLVPARFMP